VFSRLLFRDIGAVCAVDIIREFEISLGGLGVENPQRGSGQSPEVLLLLSVCGVFGGGEAPRGCSCCCSWGCPWPPDSEGGCGLVRAAWLPQVNCGSVGEHCRVETTSPCPHD
jgi:hypothetical protein